MEEIFPTSMDGFLRSNYTSLEQEYNLIQSRKEYILLQVQPEVGMDDINNATTLQAAAREESGRLPIGQQQGMTAWSTDQNRQFDRGRLLWCNSFFLKRNVLPLYCLCLFFPCIFLRCLSYFFSRFAHKNCRSRYERRNEPSGCAGCVNCSNRRRGFTHLDFSPNEGYSLCTCPYLSISLYSL